MSRRKPRASSTASKSKKASAPDPRVRAATLLGRWTRLAQGHLPLGAGCSCGAAASVPVANFEQDLLDYLGQRFPAASQAASVRDLLSGAARSPLPPELLEGLERSIESFENVHRN
jgi:hypothetical protein